jgi:hypothetical protein
VASTFGAEHDTISDFQSTKDQIILFRSAASALDTDGNGRVNDSDGAGAVDVRLESGDLVIGFGEENTLRIITVTELMITDFQFFS